MPVKHVVKILLEEEEEEENQCAAVRSPTITERTGYIGKQMHVLPSVEH